MLHHSAGGAAGSLISQRLARPRYARLFLLSEPRAIKGSNTYCSDANASSAASRIVCPWLDLEDTGQKGVTLPRNLKK